MSLFLLLVTLLVYLCNSDDDIGFPKGLKEASKFYQKAAWTFDYLAENVNQLSPSEISSSFSPQNLHFWSTTALAQA